MFFKNKPGKYNKLLIISLLAVSITLYWYVIYYKSLFINKDVLNKRKGDTKIVTLQYQEVQESFGSMEGKDIRNLYVSYLYPDKLRIEKSDNSKIVEIYNGNRYIYYDDTSNKIKYKECFPKSRPYIVDNSIKLSEILYKGNYEFFGYEEKEGRIFKIIGMTWEADGHNYMRKYWIEIINNIILPYSEEYFIDNSVVSKSTYTYLKVNEPIDDKIFEISSLPEVKIINDGVLPEYVETINDAQKFINFKPVTPDRLPEGFILSEITILPPEQNPTLNCTYINGNNRIILIEKKGRENVMPNALLGKIPCKFIKDGKKVTLAWNQGDVNITVYGNMDCNQNIVYISENISKGKLVY